MNAGLRPYLALAAAFASGDDDPRAFLERCLETIDEREAEVEAFVALNLDGARRAADAAAVRWRAGRPLSPIDGMPLGVKDIIETADMPTENGSPLFIGWRSGRDAASVAALREAGAVIVGKTVTTEFAATEPGKTRNPLDPRRTPGGSSSGSAAATAAGMVSAALGTQVIGSIVRPASYCGCVGYKPTVGSINRGGSHDHLSQSAAGVLAASLDDAWSIAREIAARAGGDPGCPGLAGPPAPPSPRRPASVGVIETAGWGRATAEAHAALEAALAALERAGATVGRSAHDPGLRAVDEAIACAMPLSQRINAWESRWPLNTYARDRDRAGLSRAMQDRLASAEAMTLEEYAASIEERARIRALFAGLAARYDVVVTLSAPGPAPLGLASTGDPVFAVPASLLGVPALSLPLLRAEGLPLGLQAIGYAAADRTLFEHAAWLDRALAQVPS